MNSDDSVVAGDSVVTWWLGGHLMALWSRGDSVVTWSEFLMKHVEDTVSDGIVSAQKYLSASEKGARYMWLIRTSMMHKYHGITTLCLKKSSHLLTVCNFVKL